MPRAAVFLDRDGTLNEEKGYVHRIEDWVWLPGVPRAIAALNALGLRTVVVTNQAGIGRGYYPAQAMERLHRHAEESLAAAGARIDAFFHCPHLPAADGSPACVCRKPAPGLLHQAARALDLDLAHSFLVGDKSSDVEAGLAAGVPSLLVLTGYGGKERHRLPADVPVVADLSAAVDWIAPLVAGRRPPA